MLYLFGGGLVLIGLLSLLYLFATTDPRQLARSLEQMALPGLVLLTVALLAVRLVVPALLSLTLLALLIWRRWGSRRMPPWMPPWMPPTPTAVLPTAQTKFLRLVTDAKTGAVAGLVTEGTFTGSRLDELALDELIMLLKECRVEDQRGAELIESFLDSTHENWRDALRESAAPRPTDMTVEEALAVLGLQAGADETEIIGAHNRLLRRLQPDAVGTDYFIAKINRARDVLLRH